MLTLRKRIFIVVSILVILVLLIILAILAISGDGEQEKNDVNENNNNNTPIVTGDNQPSGVVEQPIIPPSNQIQVKQTTTEEMEKNAAIQTAKIFLERYGSYSTDNAYQNIADSKSLVTDSLWSELEKQIKSNTNFENFIGITTRSVASNLVEWNKDNATVEVSVIKEEKRDNEVKNSQSQYEVNVVKQKEKWLVSSFTEI